MLCRKDTAVREARVAAEGSGWRDLLGGAGVEATGGIAEEDDASGDGAGAGIGV